MELFSCQGFLNGFEYLRAFSFKIHELVQWPDQDFGGNPDIGSICFFIAFSISWALGESKNTYLPLPKFGDFFLQAFIHKNSNICIFVKKNITLEVNHI